MTENGVRDGIQRLIVVFDEPNSRESIVLDINDYFLENYEAELFICASRSSPWKERALERSALSILCDWHLLYIFIYTYILSILGPVDWRDKMLSLLQLKRANNESERIENVKRCPLVDRRSITIDCIMMRFLCVSTDWVRKSFSRALSSPFVSEDIKIEPMNRNCTRRRSVERLRMCLSI